MEFSQHYYIRKEKMKNMLVPSISEVKEQFGNKFSDVWFNSCPESLRGEMSIASKLEGPGEDLWISPSDILINKVVLKPPLTNKHMKALTHEGILDIGHEIELKFRNEMKLEKQKALEDQECVLLFIAEKERNKVIAEAIEKQEEVFRIKMENLEEDFQRLLKEELERLEEYLKEVYEQVLEEKTMNILEDQEKHWNENCKKVVKEAMEVLTKKFIEDLENQESQLTEIFSMKMMGQEEKFKVLLNNQQDVFQVLLRQVKHNLQCNNFANLMYVLCVERRKSLIEQQFIVDDYDLQMQYLRAANKRNNEEIEILTEQKNRKETQCRIREECLLSVICQFQKFINYVLKATPTQAEFLLSVRKMMMFELTQAIAATAKGRHMKILLPWRRKSKESVLDIDYSNIIAPDYHDCLNELPIPIANESQASIPAMKYRENLYIREDFRNKISQGFPIRASSMIWNKDLENLINLLHESVSDIKLDDDIASIHRSSSRRSSVRFDHYDNSCEVNVGLLATHDSVDLQNTCSIINTFSKQGGVELLAAQDSLTVTNLEKVSKMSESTEKIFQKISIDTIQLHKELESSSKIRKKSIETLQLNKDSPKSSLRNVSTKLKESRMKADKKIKSNAFESLTVKDDTRIKSAIEPIEKRTKSNTFDWKKSRPSHRDSIDIIRKDFTNVDNKRLKDILTLADSDNKDQEVARYAVSLPYDSKSLDIEFSRVAETFMEINETKGEPWKIYEEPLATVCKDHKKDTFLTKPAAVKVMGHYGKEHLETSKDFTIHRLHSIVDILKKDDSLIRIFTGCTQ